MFSSTRIWTAGTDPVRARRDPPARARQIPRSAGSHRKKPGDAFLSRQFLSADPSAFDRLKQHPVRAAAGRKASAARRQARPERKLRARIDGAAHAGRGRRLHAARRHRSGARFTGWTIASPRENPEFYFDERIHDPDPKRVLGKKINAGGIKDGEQVLDLLAKNPAHRASHSLAAGAAFRFGRSAGGARGAHGQDL